MDDTELSAALDQFDRVTKNIELLNDAWVRYARHVPESGMGGIDTPELNELRREFAEIAQTLPMIDGEGFNAYIPSLHELSKMIIEDLDAASFIDDYEPMNVSDHLPQQQLEEYEHRVHKLRKRMVRYRIDEIIVEIDELLRSSIEIDGGRKFADDSGGWSLITRFTAELDRLVQPDRLQSTRMSDLHRHVRFAEPHDLRDIVEEDWPSVRTALIDVVLEGEPLSVAVADLGDLVRSKPTGSVATQLEWKSIDSDTFERLVFNMLHSSPSYENVAWLMKTNAPDRGRDISADRVTIDDLSGTKRLQVLFQCKHWTSQSVGVKEIRTLLDQVELWSKNFSVVVVVTSGRFTQDAVEWQEKRELKGKFPAVEFWPESKLEQLIAARPTLRSMYF